jgi:hypothetical protein
VRTVAAVGLLAGLALRIWSIRHARFAGEDVAFWSTGRDIATGAESPVLGGPISGTTARLPGAGYFWLLAATQLLGASPLLAYASASLGALALLVPLALAVSRSFDRETGLAFLLLGAVSPWWIVSTNSSWPPYFFPILCTLVLLGLPSLAHRPRPLAQAALAFLLIFGFQMHLSLVHYWLLALVTAAIWRPRLTRGLLIGAVLGCLCYVPYLVHEVRTGFANTHAIAHGSQGGTRSWDVLEGLGLYFLGFTTTDLAYWWRQGFWHPFDPARFWRWDGAAATGAFFAAQGLAPVAWAALVASWIVTAAGWVTFVPAMAAQLRERGRAAANVLLVAFATAVAGIPLLYVLSGRGGYPHYVSAVLPLAFLPPAYLLGRAFRRDGWRWLAGGYVILFAVGGSLGMRGYYQYDSRWSIPQSEAAVGFILERTRAPDGAQRPFQLEMGFFPSWPADYQVIARQIFHAPFLMVPQAKDVFRMTLRSPARDERPDADTLVLETLVVRHQRLR